MRAIGLAALLVALQASPALAAVTDLSSGWPPEEVAALQDGLNAVHGEEFEIVLVPIPPADGLDGEAARQFQARGFGPRQAVIVVDGGAKLLGIHLGESFREEGVEGEVLRNRIEVAFTRAASEGRGREGVVELVRQLKVLRATGNAAPFRMPWGLLAGGLAAVAGFLVAGAVRRIRERRHALRDRLALARIATSRMAAARAGLEAALGARGRTGEPAALAGRLLQLGEAAAAEAKSVGEAVRVAEGALAAGREAEVARTALALEQRAFLAEAAMATARTALAALDDADDPAPATQLVARAEAAARDWQTVRAAVAWLAEQPGASMVATNVRESRLREVRALLTAVPARPEEAEKALVQVAGQLSGVRVQRVVAGESAPGALWDLAPARYLASAASGTLALR